jgi:hypothetical protein
VKLSGKIPQPAGETQQSDTRRANGGAERPPQDRWFDNQLNQLFEHVVNEPMPPDLAELIGRLKSQGQRN